MKYVEAIIKPHKLSSVSLALHHEGATGVTVTDVRGWGHGKLRSEQAHAVERVSDFEPHVRIEVVCTDDNVSAITEAIRQAAHTGLSGDGLIIISAVEKTIRISTGAREADVR